MNNKYKISIKIIAVLISFIFTFEAMGYMSQGNTSNDGMLRPPLSFRSKDKEAKSVKTVEDFRNELVRTFLEGDILEFQFNEEGEVSGVLLLRTEQGKTALLRPDEFKAIYPFLYAKLEGYKDKLVRARREGLELIPFTKEEKVDPLQMKNMINNIWFIVRAESLPDDKPYFEYKEIKWPATSFGRIPILPIKLLEGNFRILVFNSNERYLALSQALMHEMNAIYNAYLGNLDPEASHEDSIQLEKESTRRAASTGKIKGEKYKKKRFAIESSNLVVVEEDISVLERFRDSYEIATYTFLEHKPKEVDRYERNKIGYLKVKGTEHDFNIEFSATLKKVTGGKRSLIMHLSAGTRQFYIEAKKGLKSPGEYQVVEIYEKVVFSNGKTGYHPLNPDIGSILTNLLDIILGESGKIGLWLKDMKDVKIIIKCGIRFSTEPDFNSETVTKIILYNRKLKKTRGLVITYSNDGTIETTRLGDDVEHNLVAEIVYKAPMNLAYLLALFRKDEPLPSPADDIERVINYRSLLGSASKDYTARGHYLPFLSGFGTRPSL